MGNSLTPIFITNKSYKSTPSEFTFLSTSKQNMNKTRFVSDQRLQAVWVRPNLFRDLPSIIRCCCSLISPKVSPLVSSVSLTSQGFVAPPWLPLAPSAINADLWHIVIATLVFLISWKSRAAGVEVPKTGPAEVQYNGKVDGQSALYVNHCLSKVPIMHQRLLTI